MLHTRAQIFRKYPPRGGHTMTSSQIFSIQPSHSVNNNCKKIKRCYFFHFLLPTLSFPASCRLPDPLCHVFCHLPPPPTCLCYSVTDGQPLLSITPRHYCRPSLQFLEIMMEKQSSTQQQKKVPQQHFSSLVL